MFIITLSQPWHNKAITMEVSVSLSDEQIQDQVNKAFAKILEPDNYNNPVKSEIEKLFGYNGTLRDQIRAKVAEMAQSIMTDESWHERFAMALAHEMAKEQIKLLQNKR